MKRRDFLKYAGGGAAALVVGSGMPWAGGNPAYAAVRSLNFTITDTMKEMGTHNAINDARCYFWVYKSNTPNLTADAPGPTVFVNAGDTVNVTIANALDEPHSFFIPGVFDPGTGPIAPGATFNGSFTVTAAMTGTHLYFDNLNAPVNRVMGLHGALVVMPSAPVAGQRWTPYANPTPQVQSLFNDFGTAAHWPGLAWEEGDPVTQTPPFRQYVLVLCQYSPVLNRAVGSLPPGQIFPAATFVRRFTNDRFSADNHSAPNSLPQYFTGGGQHGHFMHNNPVTVPMGRVGEPVVVRVINAGLQTHSMHWHFNHMYYLACDGVVQGAPVGTGQSNATLRRPGVIWTDTYTANPWGTGNVPTSFSVKYDFAIPFMRPPDIPNSGGIGRGGCHPTGLGDALPTLTGGLTWPPTEELDLAFGKTIPVRQSPLCYPAHDHSESSQTAQGGNYNCGVISGAYCFGDRNTTLPTFPNPHLGGDLPPHTFPMDEDFVMMIFRNNGTIVYGADEARTNGIMESSRDSGLESQIDRPPFPI